MRILILTSSKSGTAAYFLPYLLERSELKITGVVFNRGDLKSKKNNKKRVIKKIFKIGILGAINGIRMRKWYGEGVKKYVAIQNIEELCLIHNIPYRETGNINSSETIRHFKELQPDLALSLGNSYIGSRVFTIPKLGMLNVHGEVLPDYKNAQSVIWQIYNNSDHTGYTIHEINKGIDTGNILKQEKFPILFKQSLSETVSATCAEILKRSAQGMVEVLIHFNAYKQKAIVQKGGNSYTTPGIFQFMRIVRNFYSLRNSQNSVV